MMGPESTGGPDIVTGSSPRGPHRGGTTLDWLDRICIEMAAHWRAGRQVPTEAYLARNAGIRSDLEAMLDLIECELMLREECGESPQLEELLVRFPDLEPSLRRRFELMRWSEESPSIHPEGETTVQTGGPTSSETGHEGDRLPGLLPDFDGLSIEAEIGRGGMGVVYRARQRTLRRTVAVKMVQFGHSADPGVAERFRAEAEAVARVRHPTWFRFMPSVSTTGIPISSWNTSREGAWPTDSMARQWRPARRRNWSRRCPAGWRRLIG